MTKICAEKQIRVVHLNQDLYRNSFYLIDEEVHPCFFPVDLENPEDMPDMEFNYDEEDLMG